MDRAETSTRRSMRSKVMPNKHPRTVTKQKPKTGLLTGTKRKLKDPAEKAEIQLESLLTDSKSPLTTINIFVRIEVHTRLAWKCILIHLR